MYLKYLPILSFLFLCGQSHSQINHRERIAIDNGNTGMLRLQDINNDGREDITTPPRSGFYAQLNRGNFEFAVLDERNVQLDSIDLQKGYFAFIDADQDQDLDLLYIGCTLCSDKNIRMLINTDGQTFSEGQIVVIGTNGLASPQVIVDDFDNDGDDDFIMGNTSFGDLYLTYFINTSGVFDIIQEEPMKDILFYSLYSSDLDGDHKPELLIATSNDLLAHAVTPDGFTFLDTYPGGNGILKKKDLNGDDLDDFYYQEGSCIRVIPTENNGLGTPYTFQCGTSGDSGFLIADHDGDGDMDIYHGRGNAYGISVRTFDQGSFQPSKKIGLAGRFVNWIGESDTDLDGDKDLVFNTTASYTGVLERSSSNKFGLAHTISSTLEFEEIKALNVDGDSLLEVVMHQEDWIGYIDISDGEYKGYTTLFNASEWIEDVDFQDMDKDGDNDMIVLYLGSVTPQPDTALFWFENDQQVFRNPRLILADFSDAHSFIAEDFDQDDDIDIAVFSDFNQSRFLKNDGTGTFTLGQNLLAKSVESKLADFNQDQWMDIVTWDLNSKVYVIINDTMGGFLTPLEVGTKTFPQHVAVHDYDQDGDEDIIVSYLSGEWIGYRNFSFGFIQTVNFPGENGPMVSVDLLDEDVTGILFGKTARYHRPFPPEFSFIGFKAYPVPFEYVNMMIADLDGNGKSELIGYSFEEGLFVHKDIETQLDMDNDGYTGSADCHPFNPLFNPGEEEIPDNDFDENCDGIIVITDLDNDSYPASIDCDDTNPDVHPFAEEIPQNGIDEDCDGNDWIDFDQDGYPSHIDCNDMNGNVHPGAFDNPGDGFDADCDGEDPVSYFTHRERVLFPSVLNDVDPVDFDLDGRTNIMYVSHHAIGWLTYPFSSGLPSGIIDTDNTARFTRAEAGDFDHDGDMDVVAFAMDRSFDYFQNLGNGVFADPVVIRDHNTNVYSSGIAVGDIDGDGHLDAMADIASKIFIFYGDGMGGFTISNPFTQSVSGMSSVFVYDIDQDHDMELFLTSVNEGTGAHWHENNGNREFSARNPICLNCVWAGQIYFDDYDQDDQVELILLVNATNTQTNNHGGVQAYEWDGDSFHYAAELLKHDVLNNIYPADMDGNCLMDFVWGGINYLTMGMAFNYDSLPFLDHRIRDTSLHIYDIIAEDLTDDGNPEIIIATQNKNSVTVIRNDLAPHDVDGDGFVRKDDCSYCDPDIHPSAVEIPGNGIDENCDGLDFITGIDLLGEHLVKIYPNPSSGMITIDAGSSDPVSIEIYDSTGRCLLKQNDVQHMDLSGNGKGLYWVLITNPKTGDSLTKKVVVE